MKLTISLVFLLLAALSLCQSTREINDNNFQELMLQSKVLVVEFSSSTCKECKTVDKEFEELAKEGARLKKKYVFATYDHSANSLTANRVGIEKLPTILIFYEGRGIHYEKARTAKAIMEYLDSMLAEPKELKTLKAIKELSNAKGRNCILISDDPEAVKDYGTSRAYMIDYTLYYTSEKLGKEAFPEYTGKNRVVLLKDYDERKVVFAPILPKEDLNLFLQLASHPYYADMGQYAQQALNPVIEDQTKKGIFLFVDLNTQNGDKIKEEFQKAALKLADRELLFIFANLSDNAWGRIAGETIGVDNTELPSIQFFVRTPEKIRYLFTDDFTEDKIVTFAKEAKAGKLTRYYLGQQEPAENKGPVYQVVQSTFQQEVLDNDLDVLVVFFAHWCNHCQKLLPIIEQIAKKYGTKGKLKVATIDATQNEIPGYPVTGYPTILLLPGKDKTAKSYTEEHNKKDIMKFLKKHCSHPLVPDLTISKGSKTEKK